MKNDKQPAKRNGYEVEDKEEEFIHRKRAYHIYLENRNKYPLPYSAYEVHHIDFDKTNNKVSNLQILTPTEHDKLHEEHDKLTKEWVKCEKCGKLSSSIFVVDSKRICQKCFDSGGFNPLNWI